MVDRSDSAAWTGFRAGWSSSARVPGLRTLVRLVRLRTTLGAPFITCCGWNSLGALTVDHALPVVATVVSSFAIIAFAQAYNDIRDRFADGFDKADRPLPSGALGLPSARSAALVLFLVGLSAAVAAGVAAAVFALLALAAGVLYSVSLKSTVLWGNVTVAGTCAAMYLYGPVVQATATARTACGFALVFLLIFGSEVLKTGEDREADERAGIRTLATVHGTSACAAVAQGAAAALMACAGAAMFVIPAPPIAFALLGALPLLVFVTAACVTLHRRPVSEGTITAANDQWRRGWRISILGLVFT